MKLKLTACVLLVACLGAACGTSSAPGKLQATVAQVSESQVCETPVTAEARCTVTIVARVVVAETGGRDVVLESVESTVWDSRDQQDLHAVPSVLSSADLQRLGGTSLVRSGGQLDLAYELRVSIGQPPFYINGPRRVSVRVRGRDSAGNMLEAVTQN